MLVVRIAEPRTNYSYRLPPSFFAQLPGKYSDFMEEVFQLLYRGRGGYDGQFVYALTTSERRWHVRRLSKQLEEERKEREKRAKEQEAKAKAAAAKAKRKRKR